MDIPECHTNSDVGRGAHLVAIHIQFQIEGMGKLAVLVFIEDNLLIGSYKSPTRGIAYPHGIQNHTNHKLIEIKIKTKERIVYAGQKYKGQGREEQQPSYQRRGRDLKEIYLCWIVQSSNLVPSLQFLN